MFSRRPSLTGQPDRRTAHLQRRPCTRPHAQFYAELRRDQGQLRTLSREGRDEMRRSGRGMGDGKRAGFAPGTGQNHPRTGLSQAATHARHACLGRISPADRPGGPPDHPWPAPHPSSAAQHHAPAGAPDPRRAPSLAPSPREPQNRLASGRMRPVLSRSIAAQGVCCSACCGG